MHTHIYAHKLSKTSTFNVWFLRIQIKNHPIKSITFQIFLVQLQYNSNNHSSLGTTLLLHGETNIDTIVCFINNFNPTEYLRSHFQTAIWFFLQKVKPWYEPSLLLAGLRKKMGISKLNWLKSTPCRPMTKPGIQSTFSKPEAFKNTISVGHLGDTVS